MSTLSPARVPHLNGAAVAQLPSLGEIAYQQVRNAILDGSFASGEALGQEEVARQIGTSAL